MAQDGGDESLKAMLAAKEDEVQRFETQMSDLEHKFVDMSSQLSTIVAERDAALAKVKALDEDCTSLRAARTKATDRAAADQSLVSELRRGKRDAEEELASTRQRLESQAADTRRALERAKTASEQAEEARSAITRLEGTISELKAEKAPLNRQVERLDAQNRVLTDRLATAQSEAAAVAAELDQLRTSTSAIVSKLRTDLVQSQETEAACRGRERALTASLEGAREREEGLQRQLQQAKAGAAQREAALEHTATQAKRVAELEQASSSSMSVRVAQLEEMLAAAKAQTAAAAGRAIGDAEKLRQEAALSEQALRASLVATQQARDEAAAEAAALRAAAEAVSGGASAAGDGPIRTNNTSSGTGGPTSAELAKEKRRSAQLRQMVEAMTKDIALRQPVMEQRAAAFDELVQQHHSLSVRMQEAATLQKQAQHEAASSVAEATAAKRAVSALRQEAKDLAQQLTAVLRRQAPLASGATELSPEHGADTDMLSPESLRKAAESLIMSGGDDMTGSSSSSSSSSSEPDVVSAALVQYGGVGGLVGRNRMLLKLTRQLIDRLTDQEARKVEAAEQETSTLLSKAMEELQRQREWRARQDRLVTSLSRQVEAYKSMVPGGAPGAHAVDATTGMVTGTGVPGSPGSRSASSASSAAAASAREEADAGLREELSAARDDLDRARAELTEEQEQSAARLQEAEEALAAARESVRESKVRLARTDAALEHEQARLEASLRREEELRKAAAVDRQAAERSRDLMLQQQRLTDERDSELMKARREVTVMMGKCASLETDKVSWERAETVLRDMLRRAEAERDRLGVMADTVQRLEATVSSEQHGRLASANAERDRLRREWLSERKARDEDRAAAERAAAAASTELRTVQRKRDEATERAEDLHTELAAAKAQLAAMQQAMGQSSTSGSSAPANGGGAAGAASSVSASSETTRSSSVESGHGTESAGGGSAAAALALRVGSLEGDLAAAKQFADEQASLASEHQRLAEAAESAAELLRQRVTELESAVAAAESSARKEQEAREESQEGLREEMQRVREDADEAVAAARSAERAAREELRATREELTASRTAMESVDEREGALKEEIHSRDKAREAVQASYDSLVQLHADDGRRLSEALRQVGDAKREVEAAHRRSRTALTESQSRVKEAEAQASSARADVEEARQRVEEAKGVASRMEAQVTSLVAAVAAANTAMEEARQGGVDSAVAASAGSLGESLRGALVQSQELVRHWRGQAELFESRLELANAEAQAAREAADAAHRERKAAVAEAAAATARAAAVGADVVDDAAAAEGSGRSSSSSGGPLAVRLRELTKTLAVTEESNETLRKTAESKSGRIRELESEIVEARDAVAPLRKQVAELRGDAAGLKEEVSSKQQLVETYKQRLDRLVKRQGSETVDKEAHAVVTAEREEAQAQLAAAKEALKAASARAAKADAAKTAAEKESAEWHTKYDHEAGRFSKARSLVIASKKKVADLTKELEAAKAQLAQSGTSPAAASSAPDNAKVVVELRGKIAELEEELEEAKAEAAIMRRSSTTAKAQVVKLREELASANAARTSESSASVTRPRKRGQRAEDEGDHDDEDVHPAPAAATAVDSVVDLAEANESGIAPETAGGDATASGTPSGPKRVRVNESDAGAILGKAGPVSNPFEGVLNPTAAGDSAPVFGDGSTSLPVPGPSPEQVRAREEDAGVLHALGSAFDASVFVPPTAPATTDLAPFGEMDSGMFAFGTSGSFGAVDHEANTEVAEDDDDLDAEEDGGQEGGDEEEEEEDAGQEEEEEDDDDEEADGQGWHEDDDDDDDAEHDDAEADDDYHGSNDENEAQEEEDDDDGDEEDLNAAEEEADEEEEEEEEAEEEEDEHAVDDSSNAFGVARNSSFGAASAATNDGNDGFGGFGGFGGQAAAVGFGQTSTFGKSSGSAGFGGLVSGTNDTPFAAGNAFGAPHSDAAVDVEALAVDEDEDDDDDASRANDLDEDEDVKLESQLDAMFQARRKAKEASGMSFRAPGSSTKPVSSAASEAAAAAAAAALAATLQPSAAPDAAHKRRGRLERFKAPTSGKGKK